MKNYIKYFLVFLFAASVFGEVLWLIRIPQETNRPVTEKQYARDVQMVELLLFNSKPLEAIGILERYKDTINDQSERGRQWLDLAIETYTQLGYTPELLKLYERYPRSFVDQEEATLFVGKALLDRQEVGEYAELRNDWVGRSHLPLKWRLLDADQMLLQGKKEEALEILKSEDFKGEDNEKRLLQLSALYRVDDPKKAWDYLSQVMQLNPNNPELHLYRGKIFESTGDLRKAHIEFLTATKSNPTNIFLKEELADFYLRHQKYPQALKVWISSLTPPTLDNFWAQALFWGRVAMPVQVDWNDLKPPNTPSKPIIRYLMRLPKDKYWDEDAFEEIMITPDKTIKPLLSWLQVIADLKDQREKEAYFILRQHNSLNPDLSEALKQILSFRANGQFPKMDYVYKRENPFFKELQNQSTLSTETRNLLQSDYAFSAAFLAAGWNEAALYLMPKTDVPKNIPEWVPLGLTEALRQNRGDSEAIEFAKEQPPTKALNLLLGEMLLQEGKDKEAIALLQKLAQGGAETGQEAAWLIGRHYIRNAQVNNAKEVILSSGLSDDPRGKELIAQIALIENNEMLAEQIYRTIENPSPEIQAFLMRRAYSAKDWKKVEELSEELLLESPENRVYYDYWKKAYDNLNGTSGVKTDSSQKFSESSSSQQ